MPLTASAPPRSLYSAVVTVSQITRAISVHGTGESPRGIARNSAKSTRSSSPAGGRNGGFFLAAAHRNRTASIPRAISVANAAP